MSIHKQASNGISSLTMKRARSQVLFASTIGNIVSFTPTVSAVFSLFLVPISTEFGWPRATVSGVLALVSLIAVFVYPCVGRLSDIYGSRRVILVGNLLFAPAVAMVALANGSVWQFYLLFAFVGLAGAIPSTAALSKVVSEWFDDKRGFALGLTAGLGNGLGSTIMPIIAGILMVNIGWRGAFVGIGTIIICLGFPVLFLFLREAKKQAVENITPEEKIEEAAPLPGYTLKEAARMRVFWLVLVAIALGAGCVTAIFTHVVSMVMDRGFELSVATGVISVFAMVGAGWQVVTGLLLDKFYTPKIVSPMFIIAIVGLLLIEYGTSIPAVYLGGVLMGIGLGAEFGCLPFFISRYFGLKAYGSIVGVVYSVVIFTQGVTPFLMDLMFDVFGNYNAPVSIMSVCLLLGGGFILMLPSFGAREQFEAKFEV